MFEPDNILKTIALALAVLVAFAVTGCDDYYDPTYVAAYDVGDTVTVLPKRYRTVDIDGRTYYYARGTYYRPYGDSYVVVKRPVVTVDYDWGDYYDALPDRYRTVRFGNRTYYYGDGIYYRARGNRYVTVRDPFEYGVFGT